jgi:hypothetical protein
MADLLDRAVAAARKLSPEMQDDIGHLVLTIAASEKLEPVPLSPDERAAIARSKAAATRGEFATDEEVSACGNAAGPNGCGSSQVQVAYWPPPA